MTAQRLLLRKRLLGRNRPQGDVRERPLAGTPVADERLKRLEFKRTLPVGRSCPASCYWWGTGTCTAKTNARDRYLFRNPKVPMERIPGHHCIDDYESQAFALDESLGRAKTPTTGEGLRCLTEWRRSAQQT